MTTQHEDNGSGIERWADDEAAALLGGLALQFLAGPESYPVFLAWLRQADSEKADWVSGHPLAATTLAERGPDYLMELGGMLVLALGRHLMDVIKGRLS